MANVVYSEPMGPSVQITTLQDKIIANRLVGRPFLGALGAKNDNDVADAIISRMSDKVVDGANANSKAYREFLASELSVALEARDTEVVRTLITFGVDLEAPDRFGRTPLLNATVNRDAKTAKVLIECGANPQATFKKNRCMDDPLQKYTYSLVGSGKAPAIHHPYKGQTAYDFAVAREDKAMIATLAEGGAHHSFMQGIKQKVLSPVSSLRAALARDEPAAPQKVVDPRNRDNLQRALNAAKEAAAAEHGYAKLSPPKLNEERLQWAESKLQKAKSPEKVQGR